MTEQLEDAANKYAENVDQNSTGKQMIDSYKAFKAGAHWALENKTDPEFIKYVEQARVDFSRRMQKDWMTYKD